jgi:hypothetical protein
MELHTVCPFTFKYSPVTNLGNIGNENLRKFRGEKIRDFYHFTLYMSQELCREPQKKKAKCAWITPPHPLSWPCCL